MEGKGNKITRITKTKLTIGEKLFEQETYMVHQVRQKTKTKSQLTKTKTKITIDKDEDKITIDKDKDKNHN